MNDDFNGIVRAFHIQQQTGIGFCFSAFLLGVNGDCFVAVRAIFELVRFYEMLHPLCMTGIFANHKHKGLYKGFFIICRIDFQLSLCPLVAGDAIY